MSDNKSKKLLIILLLGLVYFIIFSFPNSVGSADKNMLAVFEPDEFAQYPHVIRMLNTADNYKETIRRFFKYQHYYYGYPFYLFSAIVILPIKMVTQNSASTQPIMLMLRQFVSVLPMLLSVLTLTYLFTRFKSYIASMGTFIFLLSIPAVVRNNLWWHPDSMAILFVVLTLFFLDRDNWQFGRNFLFSAAACGLASGTKLIGFFFFLAIPIYIGWGIFGKHIDLKRALSLATKFVVIMVATIVVSNPLLLFPQDRAAIFSIQQKQAQLMGFGWQISYAKGPSSWFGIITDYYGNGYFIIIALLALLIGAIKGPRRLLNMMVLSWVVPFSIYILFYVAIKPKHLFLPIALPVFAALGNLLPLKRLGDPRRSNQRPSRISMLYPYFRYVAIGVLGIQLFFNLKIDMNLFTEAMNREKDSASLQFYSNLNSGFLSKIPNTRKIVVYRDIRVYVPDTPQWDVVIKWGIVDYGFINNLNPDLILLSKQRAADYTQGSALELAADSAQAQRTYRFYSDAKNGDLKNYQLLFEDGFAWAFIRPELYEMFFGER